MFATMKVAHSHPFELSRGRRKDYAALHIVFDMNSNIRKTEVGNIVIQ